MQDLTPWANFYVITGSSAAALTGLMFVVITLVAGQERLKNSQDGVETFSSPTVVHFCAALLISAIMSAPWHSHVGPAVLLGITGAYGVFYASRILRRMGRTSVYEPGFDDWLWYALAPLVGYAAVLAAAIAFSAYSHQALFAFAACTMLFIFLGIRNAWDTVTYIAVNAGD
jgi:hypothetical protein